MTKKISVFFNGMPEFENLFAIAKRLKARGKVLPICFVPIEILWREPRLRQLIRQSGLDVTIRPNRFFKLFAARYLDRADCNLTLGDPLIDEGNHKTRSLAIMAKKQPSILVQHGVIQRHLVVRIDRDDVDYYSGLVLAFEGLRTTSVLSQDARRKVRVVGFIKPVLLPPPPRPDTIPNARRTILFCHSFRWQGRYSHDDVDRFFALVTAYAARHPEDLLIIRSHRGKVRANYKDETEAISKHPNIVISHAYKGPLKGLGMTDVLAISDVCVSSVSTAILDSIYMDLPTATYENDQQVFSELPEVTDLQSLEAFVEGPSASPINRIKQQYGEIDLNISRACEEIEAFLEHEPERPT